MQAQLIKRYKYPVETHHVITTDGYILGVHRIVNSGKPPVLLMHGLLDSSATWILTRPEAALGKNEKKKKIIMKILLKLF